MGGHAIRAEGLGKRYRVGRLRRRGTLRDLVSDAAREGVRRLARGQAAGQGAADWIWALKDVSFTVASGRVLGIVGGNGAGKSTLLKILSRITEPTEGQAEIHGRIGSLLEVGTGFHSELTGRDNIFLSGAILGMRRAEIVRRFDAIVEFAEVARFLDTPIKHYSSGMQMRLAFAVAAHLEPEILLVDEVLAVGDAAFQRKCLGKMSLVAGEGRTVLFVSHNMAAVERLCDDAIWLRDGCIVAAGSASDTVARYLASSATTETDHCWPDPAHAPGNAAVRLRRALLRPASEAESAGEGDAAGPPITIRTPFVMEFEYWNLHEGARLNLSVQVFNEDGVMVFNGSPLVEAHWHGRPFPVGLFRTACAVPGDLLNTGLHRVELLVVRDQANIIYRHPDVLAFQVQDDIEMRQDYHGKWPGVVRPPLDWRTELVREGMPERDARADARAAGG